MDTNDVYVKNVLTVCHFPSIVENYDRGEWASLFAPPGYKPGLFSDLVVVCGASTPGHTRGAGVQDKVTIMVLKLPFCNDAQGTGGVNHK